MDASQHFIGNSISSCASVLFCIKCCVETAAPPTAKDLGTKIQCYVHHHWMMIVSTPSWLNSQHLTVNVPKDPLEESLDGLQIDQSHETHSSQTNPSPQNDGTLKPQILCVSISDGSRHQVYYTSSLLLSSFSKLSGYWLFSPTASFIHLFTKASLA